MKIISSTKSLFHKIIPKIGDDKKTEDSKKNTHEEKKRSFLSIWLIVIPICINVVLIAVIWYFASVINRNVLADKYASQITIPEYPLLTDQDLNLSADSAIVFEKDSRVVVYQKESSYRFTPASTTKIMTAIVALESYPLDEYVQIPADIRSVEGSSMGLYGGEQVKVLNLLYGMMLPSGNDAAYVLSTHYPGGREVFIRQMNKKAAQLRLYNTRFFDSSGLSDNNYTSAFDLARLAAYALDNPTFRKIVQTRTILVADKTENRLYQLNNLNKLLSNSDVFGIKTGFTNEAGEVLVTAYNSSGKTYIIVVMKSGNRFEDTEKIMGKIKTAVQLVPY